jgi:hypothetical protein
MKQVWQFGLIGAVGAHRKATFWPSDGVRSERCRSKPNVNGQMMGHLVRSPAVQL